MGNKQDGFTFKTTNTKPENVDSAFRAELAGWYTAALEGLYENDEKTTWYNADRGEEKPATLWNSHNTDSETYNAPALHLTNRWNSINGNEDAISAEDLIALFKDKTPLDLATEDYSSYLAGKLQIDANFFSEEADALDAADGLGESDASSEEEAAAAAAAAAEKMKAAADSAAAAAGAAAGASASANIVEMKEQCFLLAYLFNILKAKKASIDTSEVKPIPYYDNAQNACLMAHYEEFGFMNMLTQYPTQKDLLRMSTAEISSLQPKIQLFKVIPDSKKKGEEIAIPVKFDSYLGSTRTTAKGTTEAIFKNKAKRGYGAGLQNFSFTYEGSNPFAVKKSITAKLTIFANTFDELSEPRDGYSYLDLALKTGGERLRERYKGMDPKGGSKEAQNLAKLDFRLKAIVGWELPPAKTGMLSSPTRDAINNSFVTLNLVPTIHNFDFDETGRVKFEINYFAFVEDFYNRPVFSIFSNPVVTKNMIERKLKYSSLEKDCKAADLAEARKADKDQIMEDKKAALNWLFDAMNKNNKIRYITISQDAISTIVKEGPYANAKNIGLEDPEIKTVEGSLQDGMSDDIKESTSSKTGETVPSASNSTVFTKQIEGKDGAQPIIFFFISDMLDIILDGITTTVESMHSKWLPEIKSGNSNLDGDLVREQIDGYKRLAANFKRLRVLLGPVEIVNPKNPADSRFVNLGDLPLSLKYFMQFLTEKTLQKDQIFYPLPSFLNDLFNIFLKTFLNDETCFKGMGGLNQRVRINQATVTDYKRSTGNLDTISTVMARARVKNKYARYYDMNRYKSKGEPVLNISGYRSSKAHSAAAENDYLVYYASRAQPVRVMEGSESKDAAVGIFHYAIGRDRGIIKNIRLTRTDMPGLKEVRAEQQGFDGLEQLREVYNADISCFSNVAAYPGTYIYVDPKGFAPSMHDNIGATGAGSKEGDQFDIDNLTDYGIGGYYMIIRSTHTFGPGQADTSIDARWVQEVERRLEENDATTDVDKPASKPAKCTVGENSNREEKAAADPMAEFAEFDEVLGRDGDTPDTDENLMDPFY
jgi:hypothetical protein